MPAEASHRAPAPGFRPVSIESVLKNPYPILSTGKMRVPGKIYPLKISKCFKLIYISKKPAICQFLFLTDDTIPALTEAEVLPKELR